MSDEKVEKEVSELGEEDVQKLLGQLEELMGKKRRNIVAEIGELLGLKKERMDELTEEVYKRVDEMTDNLKAMKILNEITKTKEEAIFLGIGTGIYLGK